MLLRVLFLYLKMVLLIANLAWLDLSLLDISYDIRLDSSTRDMRFMKDFEYNDQIYWLGT